MPRTKTHLTTNEYAVLGLLRHRPAHGYELQRNLAPGGGLGRVCPVEPAMVYAILKSLSGLEMIDGQWDNSVYPPKAVYATTAEGEGEFRRWLVKPVSRMREVRSDFLAKLYFVLEDEPALGAQLIRAQITACDSYLEEVRQELSGLGNDVFGGIVLESKATAAESNRHWLRQTLNHLEAAQSQV